MTKLIPIVVFSLLLIQLATAVEPLKKGELKTDSIIKRETEDAADNDRGEEKRVLPLDKVDKKLPAADALDEDKEEPKKPKLAALEEEKDDKKVLDEKKPIKRVKNSHKKEVKIEDEVKKAADKEEVVKKVADKAALEEEKPVEDKMIIKKPKKTIKKAVKETKNKKEVDEKKMLDKDDSKMVPVVKSRKSLIKDEIKKDEEVKDKKVPEKAALDEDVKDKKVPEKAAFDEDVKEKKVPEKAALDEDVKEKKVPEKAALDEEIKDKKVPEKAALDEEIKDKKVPEKAALDEEIKDKKVPEKAALDEEIKDKKLPEKTALDEDVKEKKPSKKSKISHEKLVNEDENADEITKKSKRHSHFRFRRAEVVELKESELAAMCTSSSQFKYYIAHPHDMTKYIQCDPWGTAKVMSCMEGKQWDAWTLNCEWPKDIKNLTAVWTDLELSLNITDTVDCNKEQFKCLNKGVCKKIKEEWGCMCAEGFFGEFCEMQMDMAFVYADIMNGTFMFKKYEEMILSENITENFDIAYYEKYKKDIDPKTYDELVAYLSKFDKKDVRYDILINFLVSDILKDLYPDAFYLTQFNASTHYVSTMVRLIPNLLSYSKYSFDRYEEVLVEFMKCLDRVVELIKTQKPKWEELATEYITLTNMFVNQTTELLSKEQHIPITEPTTVKTDKPLKSISDHDFKILMREEFNKTYVNSVKLIEKLAEFQKSVLLGEKKDPALATVTLGESKLPGTMEVIALFEEIEHTGAEIWMSLNNYGFWYVTNSLDKLVKH